MDPIGGLGVDVDVSAGLAAVPFLAVLAPPRLAALAALCRVEEFARGEYLFHQGQPGDRLFVIVSGQVAAARMSPRGSRVLLHVAGPGEAPGHTEVLTGGPRAASAEVLSAAVVISAARVDVLAFLATDPAALRLLSEDLGRVTHALNESVADLVFLDVPRRLAGYLLLVAVDRVVDLGMTQEDAAARLGTTRVSFNQALAGLVRQSWVQPEGRGRIRLLDVAALEAFIKS